MRNTYIQHYKEGEREMMRDHLAGKVEGAFDGERDADDDSTDCGNHPCWSELQCRPFFFLTSHYFFSVNSEMEI